MRSPKLVVAGTVAAAVLSLGTAFALPAFALPGDDPSCPEGAQKTCTQTPPETCPAGTLPTAIQPPAGEGTTCTLDSLIKARAKADILTQDQLLRLCADVRVRNLANVRIAVGHPRWEIITLDGKTCGQPKPVQNPCACETPAPETPPATVVPVVPVIPAVPVPVSVPVAPAPVTVIDHLPVTG